MNWSKRSKRAIGLMCGLCCLSLSACQTKPDVLPDPAKAIDCDPVTERCVTISEETLLRYGDALVDRAILRQQLKACQEKLSGG